MENNIINNINLDLLPEDVQKAMFEEFKTLPIKEKLIVLSKLTHGSLFKTERVDLFKINKVSVSKIYDSYLQQVKTNLTE